MSNNEIRITDLLVQRDGRVWVMSNRQNPVGPDKPPLLLGTVTHEARGRTPKRGWRFKCADCQPFWGPIVRTRREALLGLIEHWNEENTDD